MRLISLHVDTVRSLERLRIPYDDLTPDGLWGTSYHLVGLTGDQRAVLDSWNLEVNDVTPAKLGGVGELAPQLKEVWPARRAPEPVRDTPRESHVAVNAESKKHGDPLGNAAEREMVGRAAAAAEAAGGSVGPRDTSAASDASGKATNGNGTAGAAAPAAAAIRSDPTKLRVSVGGKYREAAVKKGKILLDGQSYDSPAQAASAVPGARGDWVFWEYYDAEAGKWKILDRDWQPGPST